MLPSSSFEAGLLNDIIGRCYFRGLVDACGLVKERRPGLVGTRDGVAENSAPLKTLENYYIPISSSATTTSAETSETANQHNCGCFVGEDIASYEMYGR